MPDLTIEIMSMCGEPKVCSIGGYRQEYHEHLGELSCSCKGFQFRHRCKHIEQANKEICWYHELADGKPLEEGVCPLCGGKTVYVRVGV